MYKAKVVRFFEGRQLITAVCLEDKENRLHVLQSDGRETNINLNRILHVSSYNLDLSASRDSLQKKLQAVIQKHDELMHQVDVTGLWEMLTGEGEVFDIASLSRAVFGEAADSDQGAAVLRALIEDRVRFKLQGRQFHINTPEQVALITAKRDREAQRQRDIEEGSIWLQSVLGGRETHSDKRELFIGLLKEFVLFGSEAPDYPVIREILDQSKITDQKTCFKILVSLGIFDEDENLSLHRYQIATTWPHAVVAETESIAGAYAARVQQAGVRRDLTHLHLFSIDDPYTRDIDDAISFEEHADGFQLGVHITDVASFIIPGSPLDREAARRGTSIYLPEGKIPMLPANLSEELLSLKEKEKRPAVSFLLKLSPQGELLGSEITLSSITVSKKMSYEEVDGKITGDPLFSKLYGLAAALLKKRKHAGAQLFPIPELQITVDREKNISVAIRERTAPGQVIVSECMIITNYATALFLKEQGVPALYRKQAQPREQIAIPDEEQLFHLIRQRKLLNRVEIGIEPGPHHSLGLSLYATVTSPLRKYYDMITQRQLVALLAGKSPAYGKNDLKNIVSAVEQSLTRAAIVEQERERYWLLKYLKTHAGKSFKALVVDKRNRGYSILLCDYFLEVNLTATDGAVLVPGQTITVILEKVDPFQSTLKVSLKSR